MEEKGLCVRSIDPKDRRSSYVSLTETGQERRDQGHGIMEVFAQRVVERMGEGRFRELIKQWERFGDVLKQKLQHSGMWMEWRNRTENVSATELFKTM